ncbi:hypothetical protein ACF1HJ_34010 [Streptomyces sp. NPDC013978]|uniref:hypothetical protein n=1 Tax=Streptomyces sp. NPDC013978 TaxID=3364869 RepID=UPI0037000CAB
MVGVYVEHFPACFVEHGTFHRRDEATNARPNTKRYGTFDTCCRPGRPPWEGAVTTRLRDAIEQYIAVWFPGAEVAFTPKLTVDRTPRSTPAPLATRTSARIR